MVTYKFRCVIDRAYREAVIAQQQYVKKVNYWYDNDLEVSLLECKIASHAGHR